MGCDFDIIVQFGKDYIGESLLLAIEAINDAKGDALNAINQSANIQDFYNVTVKIPIPSGYYNSESARLAVPLEIRKEGLVITYQTDSDEWKIEQFTSSDISNWNDNKNWKGINDNWINEW